jgi:hypothetical protein
MSIKSISKKLWIALGSIVAALAAAVGIFAYTLRPRKKIGDDFEKIISESEAAKSARAMQELQNIYIIESIRKKSEEERKAHVKKIKEHAASHDLVDAINRLGKRN